MGLPFFSLGPPPAECVIRVWCMMPWGVAEKKEFSKSVSANSTSIIAPANLSRGGFASANVTKKKVALI